MVNISRLSHAKVKQETKWKSSLSLSDNQCYAGVEEAVEGWAVKLPFCIELLRNFNRQMLQHISSLMYQCLWTLFV